MGVGINRTAVRLRTVCLIAGFCGFGLVALSATAQPNGTALVVRRSAATGLASFITAADGGAIPLVAQARGAPVQPIEFLREQGHYFGITDAARQLVKAKASTDRLGHTHTTFHEVYRGVRVFSGVIRTHQDATGAFLAANGDFHPISTKLDTVPGLSAEEAAAQARAVLTAGQPHVEYSQLVIVDPGWYGDPPIGDHLAFHLILSDQSIPLREAFFVDAHTGWILDQWNLVHTARDRVVIDDSLPGSPVVRTEGQAPTGDFETDAGYDYSGDMYDFFFRAFGRDGMDDAGGTLFTTVHLQSGSCPNAFGGAGGTFFCDGVLTDDIIAHEFGHGLTAFTANLIYQNQSGQLNESYSDVWGELIDLFNGDAGFPGAPGGLPAWPAHPTGPGTDTPNTMRGAECITGVGMVINSPPGIAGVYLAGAASFGPALTETGITGDVAVADSVRACDVDMPFNNPGALSGQIVLVDRGGCPFNEKIENAQDAGAIAVMLADDSPGGSPPTLGGSNPAVTIPSIGITQADGDLIKSTLLSSTVNVTLKGAGLAGGVRWLMGEDSSAFGGAIRDMWWPSCEGHPDTASHAFQTCNPADNGGVHSGSGVPNHAFAILSDGKTFNGQTVAGIGLIKAAAVWYRALTTYLTPASDFQDAYFALNQAALDLIGTPIFDPRDGSVFATFTSGDAAEVDKALLAVELNTDGACGATIAIMDPVSPNLCLNRSVLFSDDFESGAGLWTVSNSGPFGPPTPYDWVQRSSGLPLNRPGTVWFADDPSIGDCVAVDESAVHSLFSPVITLPAVLPSPTVTFTHNLATEAGWDGGNIKISVNGGGWTVIPLGAFTFNAYNGAINTGGNTNPLAGEAAWTGGGGGWGTSVIDLSGLVSGGDDVQFRFDLGKDGCTGVVGWFVDDFELHTCPPPLSKFLQGPDDAGESIPANIDWASAGTMTFSVSLDESQAGLCDGTGSAATGSGAFTLDPTTMEAGYNIAFSGLSSPETMSHVHGPAAPCQGNINIYNLPLGSPKIGTQVLTIAQMTDMMNSLHYSNIHSENFPPGEIRGQILLQVDARTLADDFISDGRPITGARWWGTDFGTATIDGWLVSFHQPSVLAMPPVPALALYYCDRDVVTEAGVALGSCDGQPMTEYAVDLLDCCLIHANVDSRSGQTPGGPLAFFEEECFDYNFGVQALVGHEFVRNELDECVEVATGNSATENFWGWRTTGTDFGFSPAASAPISMNGGSWEYGPWGSVLPACSAPNMAFEILTTTPGGSDCNGNQQPDQCEPDCNGNGLPDDCDIADCDGSPACSDCDGNGRPDECDINDGAPDLDGNGVPDECELVGDPSPAAHPHDRRKNRYFSFDPNKTENDGINVAFKVELLSINMGSCDDGTGAEVDFCRIDRGAADCKACSGSGDSCISAPIDCPPGESCDSTGAICVNDLPNSGGANVGLVWWVGPEKDTITDPNLNIHLLVSEPFRKVSDNWPSPVHAGDCEVVPQAAYGVRAVETAGGTESDELVVETTQFTPSPGNDPFWWGDAVGVLAFHCNGDIREQTCDPNTNNGDCTGPSAPAACCTGAGSGLCDCPGGDPCERAWELPNGVTNVDDVTAALWTSAPAPPTTVSADSTWVDVHGNDSFTPGSQNFDPPNNKINASDLQQIGSAFGGLPYKFYDPADCPDAPDWP